MITRGLLSKARTSVRANCSSQCATLSHNTPIRPTQQWPIRSFSTFRPLHADAEQAKTDTTSKTEDSDKSTTEDATSVDASAKELEQKKRELVDTTDKWKRSIAEYRNLQTQTKREVQAARDFAIQKFSKDLIESVDNLDRALDLFPAETLAENKDLKSLHDGLRMTETILMSTLKKHGLERFTPVDEHGKGEKFDPNRHEATFQVPQADKEDGTVFHVQQKGFILNGRVLRAAKVGVVKNS